jgi:predicted DNA binding CopG/RHH family protein
MLHFMPQAATLAPPPTAASFASLLAALASPAPKPEPGWNDDDLGEDVATLSYERALRNHGRYRSSAPGEAALSEAAEAKAFSYDDGLSDPAMPTEKAAKTSASNARAGMPQAFANAHKMAEAEMARRTSTAFERNRKDASITIRMSQAECTQLHARASEAGLSVSAYLRSCTFEAEALRAQVKETIAELRSASAMAKPSAPVRQPKPEPKHRWSGLGWISRILPHWHPSQRVAQA